MFATERFELMAKMSKNLTNNPFPDPKKPYPGIDIVGYFDDAGKGMNLWDAIRIANVMLDCDR